MLGVGVPAATFNTFITGVFTMCKTGWIHNVTVEIANKAGIGNEYISRLEQIEKTASYKLGMRRCKRDYGENIGHYAHRLIKHFGLDVNYLKNKTKPKKAIVEKRQAKKIANVYNKKYAGMHLGKFGAASEVRKIDPKSLDLFKYLEDKQG